MQPPRPRHPTLGASIPYTYPEHLRRAIDELPRAPGVYTFHGEERDLPLYIGKSVDLRGRVLAHLRNPDEARLLRQTRRISHARTAGEIGALLLEAQLIKQQSPLYNQKLRRTRHLCAIRLSTSGQPEIVYSAEIDFATTPRLYGLYTSRRAATTALEDIADEQRLCHGALGLERLMPGRPCFRSALGRCAGQCRGAERRDEHDARLARALERIRIRCWPYPGPVGLVERHEDLQQIHVIHNWAYLGSVAEPEQAASLTKAAPGFDADGYRILCGPLLAGRCSMVTL